MAPVPNARLKRMLAECRMSSRYHVRQSAVPAYSPANHEGTRNQRLIGRDNVGARNLEIVLGTILRGRGAMPHAHPGVEQACFLLEGTAHVEVGDDTFEIAAGEACFFPPDTQHVFLATSPTVRVLVVYSPPYEENPERVIRA
jgi:quercetin dioxygenase-like cupin family protein